MRNAFVLAVSALLTILLSTSAWSMSRRPPEPPGESVETHVAETVPTSRFEGVELVGEDTDGTVWKLHAEEGWGEEAEKSGNLRGVLATLRKGDYDMVLEAGRARIDLGTTFDLSGGVLIRWGEFAARVDRASYLRHRGLITSESRVLFTGPGIKLEGMGVEVEIESRVVRIPAEARALLGEDRM